MSLDPRGRYLLGLLALAGVYWGAAELGFTLAFSVRQVTPVWPPTGIALAALLRFGTSWWPGISAGAFAANLAAGAAPWTAAGIASGNTLEALAGVFLLRRVFHFDDAVEKVRDVAALAVAAALAPMVSATVGVASLGVSDLIPAAVGIVTTWVIWWVGDAMGLLLVTPLLLGLSRKQPPLLHRRPLEAAALALGIVAFGLLVLAFAPPGAGHVAPHLEYLVFPLVAWSALRFRQREVILAVTVISVLAIWGAIHDHGPFGTGSLTHRLLLLQVFLGVITTTALALGALVTERRRAYEEARLANASKDEFLAVLSHELRTPLTPILGWTRLLREADLDAASRRHALEVIERNTRMQVRLVEDLLDASRIVSGKMTFDRRLVDLGLVLSGAVEAVRDTARSRSIRLLEPLAETGLRVWGDAERLQQALVNVLANALKFTPSGGRVELTAARRGSEIQVAVSDTGEGIAPEFLGRMFMPFSQAETGTTRSHGGLGLGLSIVRHIVEQHGGHVSAASAGKGQGTTVTLTLPRADPRLMPAPEAVAAPAPPTERRLQGVRVLAVDDDPDARDLTCEVLRRAGADVRDASGAGEALKVVDAWRPDVLVSDLAMPGEDGLDLLRAIRARLDPAGPDLRAVLLTAYAGDAERHRAIEGGYDVHLAKPVPPAEIVATVVALVPGRVS